MSHLLYLYGFTPPGQPEPPGELRGIAGAPVSLAPLGDVTAVVSEVPDAEYAAEAVQERMHDLDWLGEQGARHERVVTWFVDHGQILPARLLTLYSTREALRTRVEPRASALVRQLDRLRDRREWDLKVTYDPKVLAQHLGEISESVAAMDRERAGAAPGRGYLLDRKRDKLVREETARGARRLAHEALAALEAVADAVRTLPLQRSAEADAEGGLILNAALLLQRRAEDEARATAERERERVGPLGVTVELTGPWAPYRFLDEAESDDPEGAST